MNSCDKLRTLMDSLQRAKKFLARKASKLALTVVPLAALAISVPHARASGVTLSFGSNCAFSGGFSSSGSCATTQQGTAGGDSNMNWIALNGSGHSDFSGGSIKFLANGSGSGVLASGSVPVSWDFSITSGTVDPTVNWTVLFELIFSGGGTSSFHTSGSASVTTTPTVIQSGGAISTSGGTVTGYELQLTASDSVGAGGYTLVIPGSATLDLNPEVAAVPEPSSLLVIGAAGALMILRRRKKRT